MKVNEPGGAKKPYEKPNLRIYGDIRTMTRASNHGKVNDGMPNKTN